MDGALTGPRNAVRQLSGSSWSSVRLGPFRAPPPSASGMLLLEWVAQLGKYSPRLLCSWRQPALEILWADHCWAWRPSPLKGLHGGMEGMAFAAGSKFQELLAGSSYNPFAKGHHAQTPFQLRHTRGPGNSGQDSVLPTPRTSLAHHSRVHAGLLQRTVTPPASSGPHQPPKGCMAI